MPQLVKRHEEEHLYAASPATPAGEALAVALLRLKSAQTANENASLSASGVPLLDLTALRYLVQAGRDERDLSHKDLAAVLRTSQANVTKVIDRLAEQQLIERVEHPHDRRARFLVPTIAGASLVASAISEHHTVLVTAINALDEQDALAATRALEAITRELTAHLEPQGE